MYPNLDLALLDNIRLHGEQRHHWQIERDMFPDMTYQAGVSLGYPNVGYPPIPVASDDVIWGIDISGYYDGIVDWQKFRSRGGTFCFIKIADGTVRTRYATENVDGALNAGLFVFGYCWLYRNIRISGHAQGAAWSTIAKSLGVQGVVVDYEWTFWNGAQDNPDPSDLYGAVIPFEQAYGNKPMIYSAPGFMGTMPVFWKAYKLWIAQYNVLKPNVVMPWGTNGHTFWQLTDRWRPGLELGVDPKNSNAEDGDLFNGTLDDLYKLVDNVVPTPIPDPIPVPPPTPNPNPFHVVLADGIDYIDNVWKGIDYHLIIADLKKVNFVFDDSKNKKMLLVSVADWSKDVLVTINGGGFQEYNTYGVPWGICSSRGHKYCTNHKENSLYIAKDNTVSFTKPKGIWNAVNYSNKFITQSVETLTLDRVILDNRTMFGVKSGFVYLFSTAPMSKQDAADLGQYYGLEELANMDGGQSTAMRIKGYGIVNGVNARKVTTHIGIISI